MIYSLYDIQAKVTPIADTWLLSAVYVFGSYARSEAREDSDIDIIVDDDGSAVATLLDMVKLQDDLELALGKKVSLVFVDSLELQMQQEESCQFARNAVKEAICIYERT